MKIARIQRIVAALSAALILLITAAPAWSASEQDDPAQNTTSPPMFDLFFLRPIGIVGTVIGTAVFLAPVLPLTLITRPTDLGKPFNKLVVSPIRYVVVDPLGEH